MEEKKPLFTKVEQISMVVRDAKASAKFLCDEYGIGPWVCVQFGDAGDGNDNWIPIENVVLDGEEIGTYSIDCCCCKMPSGIEIEIISPKKGDSVFARFLKEKGPQYRHNRQFPLSPQRRKSPASNRQRLHSLRHLHSPRLPCSPQCLLHLSLLRGKRKNRRF